MNRALTQLVAEFDRREITAADSERILTYAASIEDRLRAAEQVDKHSNAAIRETIARLKAKYPNFAGYHNAAWGKSARDMNLTMNVLAQAMILDDVGYAEEKVIVWLRTILASFSMTPQHVRDAYAFLLEEYGRLLSPADLALIRPALQRCIDEIGAFPEPSQPRV